MTKRILITLIVAIGVLGGIAAYQKYLGHEPQPENRLEKRIIPLKFDVQSKSLPPIVREINARIKSLNSISCESVELKFWRGNQRLRLSGSLACAKPNLFRIEVSSLLGKELDLGSNEKAFWYWSKRDRDPGLHFARHEDFQKTRLKTPFNPMFIRSTLGIEELAEGCEVGETEAEYVLSYPRAGGSGEPLKFSIFVNKSRKRVEGYGVSTAGGKTLVACDVQEYSGDIPTKILYSWYEEDSVMLIRLSQVKVNSEIDAKTWSLPDYRPKTDIGKGD